MSFKYICVALAAFVACTVALTQENKEAFQASIAPMIGECSKEYGVSEGDIQAAKASKSAEGLDTCFLGCFFTKLGVINPKGIFEPESAKTKAKEFFKDAEDLKKLNEIADICEAINAETVSDGKQVCERAQMLTNCFIKNKGGFSPF